MHHLSGKKIWHNIYLLVSVSTWPLYSHSFVFSPFCVLQSQGSGTDFSTGWNTECSSLQTFPSMHLVFISSWLWVYTCSTVHYLCLSDLENHFSLWTFSGTYKHTCLPRHICCKSWPVESPLLGTRSTYKEEVDDDFFRQQEEASCSQALLLTREPQPPQ